VLPRFKLFVHVEVVGSQSVVFVQLRVLGVAHLPGVQSETELQGLAAGLLQTFGWSLQSAFDVHAPPATPLLFWYLQAPESGTVGQLALDVQSVPVVTAQWPETLQLLFVVHTVVFGWPALQCCGPAGQAAPPGVHAALVMLHAPEFALNGQSLLVLHDAPPTAQVFVVPGQLALLEHWPLMLVPPLQAP